MSPIFLSDDGYTLTEYRASMAAKGYDVSDTTTLDVAINEARRRLVRDHRWSWLQLISSPVAATVGDPEVSLDTLSDILWLDSVRLTYGSTDPIELAYLGPQEFRTQETRSPADGVPCNWTATAGSVRLYPTPDLAYALEVDYASSLADLAAGSDVDDIPRALADLVVWAAIPDVAFRQREPWAMQYAQNEYTARLALAVGQDNIRQRQSSQQVRSGYWGRG